jgi:hypothetical protein
MAPLLTEVFRLHEASDVSKKRALERIKAWIKDSPKWKNEDDPPLDVSEMDLHRLAAKIGDIYDKSKTAKGNAELVKLLREIEKIVQDWVEQADIYATSEDEEKLCHEYICERVPLGGK